MAKSGKVSEAERRAAEAEFEEFEAAARAAKGAKGPVITAPSIMFSSQPDRMLASAEVAQLQEQRALQLEAPPRLPSIDIIMAGETPELQRLRALEERIAAFSQQQPPSEQPLPPLAAIAMGALGALDPRQADRLQPQVDRFRRQPIDDFERLRRAQAEALSLEASMIPAFTEAEQRQTQMRQLTGAIQEHFDNANELIDGASQIAQQLAQDERPGRRLAATELMRRVSFYHQLIESGMQAEPDALGERFLAQAESEAQSIAGIINSQNEAAIEQEDKEALIRLQSDLAFKRAMAVEKVRAASRMRTAGNAATMRDFRKASEGYAALSQFLPILARQEELAKMRVGGPVSGQFGALGPGGDLRAEFEGNSSLLASEVLFGEGGKALAIHERKELAGKFPESTQTQTKQLAQIAAARTQIMNKMAKMRAAWEAQGFDLTDFDLSMDMSSTLQLQPGESPLGEFELDDQLLGQEEEE